MKLGPMQLGKSIFAGLAVAGLLAALPVDAEAQSKKGGGSCVSKGGRGTGSTTSDAQFQAWEAVLQATDWGMWSAWVANGAQVKRAAAGYSVSNIRERCGNGGSLGKECTIHATLCK